MFGHIAMDGRRRPCGATLQLHHRTMEAIVVREPRAGRTAAVKVRATGNAVRQSPAAGLGIAVAWLLVPCALVLYTAAARAQEPQLLDAPGGGHVLYGTVESQTPQGAMAAMLRQAHARLGAAPQVGKVFRSRDGQNYGAFFTVDATTPDRRAIAGLVIVSMAASAQAAAAALYDEASRFARTEPQLLRTLDDAWRRASAPASSTAGRMGGPGSGVPPLSPTRFPDGSGSVDLPQGWRVAFASHGAAKIVGPNGELVLLSNSQGPIYDPANPQVQSQLRYANPRNAPLLCPGGDALQTYLCVLRRGGSTPAFQLSKSQALPLQGRFASAVLVDADIDLHDGKGPMRCELGLRETAPGKLGQRTLGINGTCAPQASAAQAQPTLKAIFDSYRMNEQVVVGQYQADQRASIAAGNRARAQAADAHATEDARSAAFQAHMDNIDRFSKSFQNYQLDQTELQDSEHHARGAVPNALADALVKANPDRFQVVPTQDFLKGSDF